MGIFLLVFFSPELLDFVFSLKPLRRIKYIEGKTIALVNVLIVLPYKNYNFVFTFYGRVTWYVTLREEQILRVFEKRVLSRIFGPKSEENGQNCIRGNFSNLHSSPNIIRKIK
jgi:lauroyl/myristoyl acyltransferase